MEIQKIEKTYGRSPQADALFDLMGKKSVHSIFLQGLLCSSAPMFFASLEKNAFIQMIMGEQSMDYFDTFVEEWYDQGGRELTEKIREENS